MNESIWLIKYCNNLLLSSFYQMHTINIYHFTKENLWLIITALLTRATSVNQMFIVGIHWSISILLFKRSRSLVVAETMTSSEPILQYILKYEWSWNLYYPRLKHTNIKDDLVLYIFFYCSTRRLQITRKEWKLVRGSLCQCFNLSKIYVL